MNLVFTKHALKKLKRQDVKNLKIKKRNVEEAVTKPEAIYPSRESLVAIRKLDKGHSLCVVCKKIRGGLKIITFFPAKRGRYESKIL